MTLGALWGAVPVAGAVGVAAWGAWHPAARIYGPVLNRVAPAGGAKRVALTFDDGPNPAITPRLLDLLEKHRARATFFVVGRFVRACPDLLRETAARGHQISNHTDTHPSLVWCSRARIREELRRCQESLVETLRGDLRRIGRPWMRPPFGARGPQLDGAVRAEKLVGVVTWTVICGDWRPQPAERLIRKVGRVKPGDILVLHDGDHRFLNGDRARTVEALEHWLPRWRDAGIEFVTMDEAAGG